MRMTDIKTVLKSFWNDEQGQTTTEYILIVAVVAMIAIKLGRSLNTTLLRIFTGRITDVGSRIDGEFSLDGN